MAVGSRHKWWEKRGGGWKYGMWENTVKKGCNSGGAFSSSIQVCDRNKFWNSFFCWPESCQKVNHLRNGLRENSWKRTWPCIGATSLSRGDGFLFCSVLCRFRMRSLVNFTLVKQPLRVDTRCVSSVQFFCSWRFRSRFFIIWRSVLLVAFWTQFFRRFFYFHEILVFSETTIAPLFRRNGHLPL